MEYIYIYIYIYKIRIKTNIKLKKKKNKNNHPPSHTKFELSFITPITHSLYHSLSLSNKKKCKNNNT